MYYCRQCNSRLGSTERICQNCGHATSSGTGKPAREKSGIRSLLRLRRSSRGRDDSGFDLGDSGALDLGRSGELGDSGFEVEVDDERVVPARGPLGSREPVFALDADGVRQLLTEEPEHLEKGLALVTDKRGTPVGAGYSTPVGEIDLLAEDSGGSLVVVVVSEGQHGEGLVALVLKQMGWVQKHVARRRQRVRGIVLVDSVPENLSYAATAVGDTVAFMVYRVALSFEHVEV